jgi:quinol monooxygenase YgiN
MIIAIVKAQILKGKEKEIKKVADILQYKFCINEEGCEQYESFIDGNTFLTIERWTSQEYLDIHLEAQHVKKYVPLLRKCVINETFDVQFIKSSDVTFIKI